MADKLEWRKFKNDDEAFIEGLKILNRRHIILIRTVDKINDIYFHTLEVGELGDGRTVYFFAGKESFICPRVLCYTWIHFPLTYNVKI